MLAADSRSMARRKWSRLTLNLDPLLASAAKKRATEGSRSFAGYIKNLIEKDLERDLPGVVAEGVSMLHPKSEMKANPAAHK